MQTMPAQTRPSVRYQKPQVKRDAAVNRRQTRATNTVCTIAAVSRVKVTKWAPNKKSYANAFINLLKQSRYESPRHSLTKGPPIQSVTLSLNKTLKCSKPKISYTQKSPGVISLKLFSSKATSTLDIQPTHLRTPSPPPPAPSKKTNNLFDHFRGFGITFPPPVCRVCAH